MNNLQKDSVKTNFTGHSTKKVPFNILSNIRCRICGKRLKQNLVNRNPEADLCFVHWVKENLSPQAQIKRLHLKKIIGSN